MVFDKRLLNQFLAYFLQVRSSLWLASKEAVHCKELQKVLRGKGRRNILSKIVNIAKKPYLFVQLGDISSQLIPVHFAGHPCDLKEINRIAKRHGLMVIEDAAHALGAEYRLSGRGKWIRVGDGRFSDMTILSFHPVKSITTGEGGAVLTNDQRLYEKLLMLRNHGITKERKALLEKDEGPWYSEMEALGFNYRITDFQCALGTSQLKRIGPFLKRRQEIVALYNEKLSQLEEIVLPVTKPFVKSAWHIYCIRLKDPSKRKRVFEKLRNSNIGVQVHYIPVYFHPYYRRLGYKKGMCKRAEDYYRRTMTLPVHPGMTDRDVHYVVKTLKESFA